jgi:hypothetical protein
MYGPVIAAFVDACYEPEISITLNRGTAGMICERGLTECSTSVLTPTTTSS